MQMNDNVGISMWCFGEDKFADELILPSGEFIAVYLFWFSSDDFQQQT